MSSSNELEFISRDRKILEQKTNKLIESNELIEQLEVVHNKIHIFFAKFTADNRKTISLFLGQIADKNEYDKFFAVLIEANVDKTMEFIDSRINCK